MMNNIVAFVFKSVRITREFEESISKLKEGEEMGYVPGINIPGFVFKPMVATRVSNATMFDVADRVMRMIEEDMVKDVSEKLIDSAFINNKEEEKMESVKVYRLKDYSYARDEKIDYAYVSKHEGPSTESEFKILEKGFKIPAITCDGILVENMIIDTKIKSLKTGKTYYVVGDYLEEMNLRNYLKQGYIVQTADGDRFVISGEFGINHECLIVLNDYDCNLENCDDTLSDIIGVYRTKNIDEGGFQSTYVLSEAIERGLRDGSLETIWKR